MLPAVCWIGHPECASVQRRYGRSPDFQPRNRDPRIDQQHSISDRTTHLRFGFEQELVVAWNHDLISMRESAYPVVKIVNLRFPLAEEREVSSVDKQVTGRDIQFPMKFMGIADANYAYHLQWLASGTASSFC
jgi:hypothetical protein